MATHIEVVQEACKVCGTTGLMTYNVIKAWGGEEVRRVAVSFSCPNGCTA